MSSGHSNDDPAAAGAVIRVLQRNVGLRVHVSRYPIISRDYRVPYLAGSSIDGRVVYIDAQTPVRFEKSGIEPDEYYAAHEMFEWFMIAMLGMDYEAAHKLAHGYERMKMRMDGVSDEKIEQYEVESMGLVNIDEHLKLEPDAFPSDLFLAPYEEDEDNLDKRLLPLLKQAQIPGYIGYGRSNAESVY